MKHVLYPGQQFRFLPFSEYGGPAVLPNILHEASYDSDRRLIADKTRAHTASAYEGIVVQGGGEHDGRKVQLRMQWTPDTVWTVVDTDFTGGGTGMGVHDVYPDGHFVTAKGNGGVTLTFYQSGCFNGLVPPHGVELLNGDTRPDVSKVWKNVQVDQ